MRSTELRFRCLATARTGLRSLPGTRDRNELKDCRFWKEVSDGIDRPNWHFLRTGDDGNGLNFAKASGDDLPRPLELAKIQIDPGEYVSTASRFNLQVLEVLVFIFDHGVSIVECEFCFEVESDQRFSNLAETLESDLQKCTSEIAESSLTEVFTILENEIASTEDFAAHVLVETDDHSHPTALNKPLWVARALLLDANLSRQVTFSEHWLSAYEDLSHQLAQDLCDGRTKNVTDWMNYVYRVGDAYEQLWTCLRRAQFFYTAMYAIDRDLQQILAWSMGDPKKVSVVSLRRQLKSIVDQTQAILFMKAEVIKFSSRSSRSEITRILDIWDYDEVLDQPVRDKLQSCQSRLTGMATERANENAMFTDIILMVIGVTSVLATMIALVQFGRDSGSDPAQTGLDLGRNEITSWLSSQSIDSIVIVSSVTSLILVSVYIWKRKQSIS